MVGEKVGVAQMKVALMPCRVAAVSAMGSSTTWAAAATGGRVLPMVQITLGAENWATTTMK